MATDAADVACDNRAFRYGYGLFETILFKEGIVELKNYHFERLFNGLKQLYFDVPHRMTAEWLEHEIINIVKKNNLEKICRVRLQMFAGAGGLYDGKNQTPQFIIECFPLEATTLQLNDNGLVTGIAKDINKNVDSLSNLKSCNALIYVIAAQQAKKEKWNDALICNASGRIIETTIANIFWVKKEIVYTTPLSEGCVAGVMRRFVIEKIKEAGILFQEQSLSENDLWQAEEIFLTNAIKRIKWIKSIDKKVYNCEYTKYIYNSIF